MQNQTSNQSSVKRNSHEEASLNLKDKFKQAVSSGDLNEVGKVAKDVTTDALGNIQKTVGNYIQSGQREIEQAEKNVEKKIQQYPVRSILMAAGVGLVAGLVIKTLMPKGA